VGVRDWPATDAFQHDDPMMRGSEQRQRDGSANQGGTCREGEPSGHPESVLAITAFNPWATGERINLSLGDTKEFRPFLFLNNTESPIPPTSFVLAGSGSHNKLFSLSVHYYLLYALIAVSRLRSTS